MTRRAAVVWLVALWVAVACVGDDDELVGPFTREASPLDVRRVVAIGDGYLAGSQDGALFREGQDLSVAALFAAQVGADPFAQPLISDPGLATNGEDAGRLTLIQFRPRVIERIGRSGSPLDPDLALPYNNLAVPGALLTEALTARSLATSITGNRFYDIVLRNRGTFSEQAAEIDATLILLWLGTGDVLRFALAGGDPTIAPGLPTPEATFALTYEALLDELLSVTPHVVPLNIPDVTLLPFFNTVRPIAIDPDTGEPFTITVFDNVVDPVTGDTISVQRDVPVPLIGNAGPLPPTALVSLDAEPLIALGIGVPQDFGGLGSALPDRVILDVGEQTLIRNAVAAYNANIETLASERDLPVVDVERLFARADDGVVSDGVLLTTEFLVGQMFSLDGTHLTPKGAGVVANELIRTLNAHFGTRIPTLRTEDLPGIPILRRP